MPCSRGLWSVVHRPSSAICHTYLVKIFPISTVDYQFSNSPFAFFPVNRHLCRLITKQRINLKWLSLILLVLIMLTKPGEAQVVTADSVVQTKQVEIPADSAAVVDSLRRKRIKRTIIHSAVVPGWGQINNKQAWKLPFVAAAVGLPVWAFVVNLQQYQELRQAYIYRTDTIDANDNLIPPEYDVLSDNSIKYYRDEYRKNVDYSVIFFLIGWGLNVADAAVFAHLRDFDVSDKLSMRVKPTINLNGHTNVSLVFSFKKPEAKYYPLISP